VPVPGVPDREHGLHAPLAPPARRLAPARARRRRSPLSAHQRGYGVRHREARLVVLERDGWVCVWCGAPATEADHIGPKVPDPRVMVAACKPCNARRGARKGNLLRFVRPSRRW
jgi:hypothetical protein